MFGQSNLSLNSDVLLGQAHLSTLLWFSDLIGLYTHSRRTCACTCTCACLVRRTDQIRGTKFRRWISPVSVSVSLSPSLPPLSRLPSLPLSLLPSLPPHLSPSPLSFPSLLPLSPPPLPFFLNVLLLLVLQASHKKYYGHSAHVTNVRFTFDDQYLLSVGGDDSW